jgi:hypothetical protein
MRKPAQFTRAHACGNAAINGQGLGGLALPLVHTNAAPLAARPTAHTAHTLSALSTVPLLACCTGRWTRFSSISSPRTSAWRGTPSGMFALKKLLLQLWIPFGVSCVIALRWRNTCDRAITWMRQVAACTGCSVTAPMRTSLHTHYHSPTSNACTAATALFPGASTLGR